MPDAPFHVMGRRADSGELFVGAIVPKEKITNREPPQCARSRRSRYGARGRGSHCRGAQRGQGLRRAPAFVFERRSDIELETGLILAGDLVIDIPKHVQLEERHQRLIMENIVGLLIKMTNPERPR